MIKGPNFIYKRELVKIRVREKGVKLWAPKNDNRWE